MTKLAKRIMHHVAGEVGLPPDRRSGPLTRGCGDMPIPALCPL